MINILLNASVTGGIVVLLWYLSYPLSKKYFKASWHYAVLKITMVFMLIPISVLAPMFNNVLAGLFSQPEIPNISGQIQKINIDAETINSVNSALSSFVFPEVQPSQPLSQPENVVEQPSSIDNTDNVNDDIKTTTPDIPYLQIIWLIVAVLLFVGGIRKMHRFKKQILNNSSSTVDSETQELFLQCKEQLGVRGKITLRTSGYIRTPFVFGLMKPFVIFPETGMSAEEKRLAFTHELTHIKNGDLWLKFIASVISAVHWFNPLAHLLSRKISVISEEYCDECVIKTMTKEERLVYGSLILKVFSDMVAPQVQLSKFCSTLSAPTKNIKRRLSNMMNFKKSRKSMIVLSLIAALALCSLATVYAFAANTGAPENSPTDLSESVNIYTGEDVSNAIIQQPNISGTLGIGYTDDNGEVASRLSNDGGITWYYPPDDYGVDYQLIPDPDIPAIEWMTYDEFKAWVDEKRAELTGEQDELIEEYEAELEDLKNGTANSAGKIIIGNNEFVFVFYSPDTSYYSVSTDGETFQTYSQEEMDSLVAEYEAYMSNQPSQEEIDAAIAQYQSYMSSQPSQEEMDAIITQYESAMSNVYTIIGGESAVTHDDGSVSYDVYGYKYTADDGEPMGFGADTFEHLYKLVREHFEEQIVAGKITREEAESRLAELTKEGTRETITIDAEGNIINN